MLSFPSVSPRQATLLVRPVAVGHVMPGLLPAAGRLCLTPMRGVAAYRSRPGRASVCPEIQTCDQDGCARRFRTASVSESDLCVPGQAGLGAPGSDSLTLAVRKRRAQATIVTVHRALQDA